MIESPPHISSFEALIHSYGQRLYEAARNGGAFPGFTSGVVEGIETALEDATDWLIGASYGGKKALDLTDMADEVGAI